MANDHRTPGQVACDTYFKKYGDELPDWKCAPDQVKSSWEAAAAAVLAHAAPAGGGTDPWAALRRIAELRFSGAGEPLDDALDIADKALAAAPEPAAGGGREIEGLRRELSDLKTTAIVAEDLGLWTTKVGGQALYRGYSERKARACAAEANLRRTALAAAPEPAEQPGYSAGDDVTTMADAIRRAQRSGKSLQEAFRFGLDLARGPDRTAYAVIGQGHARHCGPVLGIGSTGSEAIADYNRKVQTMSEERIKVTVHAPQGKRAHVLMWDNKSDTSQHATILPGQTQDFFVDEIRSINVREVSNEELDVPEEAV